MKLEHFFNEIGACMWHQDKLHVGMDDLERTFKILNFLNRNCGVLV